MIYEIGSEFELNFESIVEQEINDLEQYLQNSENRLVSSGRCGIKQVLLNLINENDGKDEFLLPSYLCPSIVQPFKELKLNIVFYNVNLDLTIDLDDLKTKINNKTKSIYFVNYFGVLQPENVASYLISLKQRNICLIEDITHNFFSKRNDIGDYLIGSLRKWGPLPHGGVVLVKRKVEVYQNWYETSNLALKIGQLRAFGQQLKFLYLNGLRSENVKSAYLSILRDMDKALYSHIEVVPMDELSVNLVKKMDYESLTRKRRENYKYLYNSLKSIKEIDIVIGDIKDIVTPLGFHVALKDRNQLREFLVKNGVYASVHWGLPQEVQQIFEGPTKFSNRILTIPCDQRYGQKEMEFIVELIQTYFLRKENRSQCVLEKVGEGR